MKSSTLLLSIVLFITTPSLFSQSPNKSSVDVNAGISYPHSDVRGTPGFFASAGYKYTIAHPLSVRLGVLGGSITGSETKSGQDLQFTNNLFGVMLGADFNLFALTKVNELSRYVDPYVFVEGGPLFSNISDINQVEGFGTQAYSGMDLTYSLGGGLRVYLTPSIDLNSRFSFFSPNMDLLDGHNPNSSGNISNDYFSTFQVGVNIKLGSKSDSHEMWASRNVQVEDEKMQALKAKEEAKQQEVLSSDEEDSKNAKVVESAKPSEKTKTSATKPSISETRNESSNSQKKESAKSQSEYLEVQPEREEKAIAEERIVAETPKKETTTNQESNEVTANKEKSKIKTKSESAGAKESSKMEVTPEEEYNVYKTGVQLSSGQTGNYRYYIIVGSFSKLENAQTFIANAKNSETMEVITDNTTNLFRVAASKTNDLEKALRALDIYKNSIDPDSWFLENANY